MKTADAFISGITFRTALQSPPQCYEAIQLSSEATLDTVLTKLLFDMKSGRHRQAEQRYRKFLSNLSLDSQRPLIDQIDNLNSETAPLLIFELLFLMGDNTTIGDSRFWRYASAIDAFDPDDTVCHGALYNLLLVQALRKGDLSVANEFAKLSLSAYDTSNSGYLSGFIHLHLVYLRFSAGETELCNSSLDDARTCFEQLNYVECELTMVEITRLWINAEIKNILPRSEQLRPLRDQLLSGEFWPETFLVLAAMLLRALDRENDEKVLVDHSALEAILRVRGMTQVLPAMQLLREEFLLKGRETQIAATLNLTERHLILLMPTVSTFLLNYANSVGPSAVKLPRIQVLGALSEARLHTRSNQPDQSKLHYLRALGLIETHEFQYILGVEAEDLADFCRKCRGTKTFVERARHYQNTLLNGLKKTSRKGVHPLGLTPSEMGILKRLTKPIGNKSIARDIGISEATVKFHLKNLYRKLGVHSRRDALEVAVTRGLVEAGANQRMVHYEIDL